MHKIIGQKNWSYDGEKLVDIRWLTKWTNFYRSSVISLNQ